MWNLIDNIPRDSLDGWFRWLTFFAIVLLGLGAACGSSAFFVSNRIEKFRTAELNAANTQIQHLNVARLNAVALSSLAAAPLVNIQN
jgi:hypothetical protein